MANIGDVTARLRADVSDYVSGMQRASAANQTLSGSVAQTNQQFFATQAQLSQVAQWYDRTMKSSNGVREAIENLRTDISSLNVDFKLGRVSASDYAGALAQIRAEALNLRTAGGLNPAEMSALNSVLVRTVPAAEGAAGGMGRITLAAGMMTSSVLGGNFMLGRLLGSLGVLGISAPAVIGVLAGLAAIVEIFHLSTKSADDYQKALDADVKKIQELGAQKLPPQVRQSLELGRGSEQVQNLTRQLADANRDLADAERSVIEARSARDQGVLNVTPEQAANRVKDAQQVVSEITRKIQDIENATTQIVNARADATEHEIALQEYRAGLETNLRLSEAEINRLVAARKVILDDAATKDAQAIVRGAQRLGQADNDLALATATRGLLETQDAIMRELADHARGIGKELANVRIISVDVSEQWVGWRQSLDAVRSPLDDVLDRAKALKDLQAQQSAAQHPGGVLGPEGIGELRGLGIDPTAFQRQIDLLSAPIDKATADVRDRFSSDMSRVGREGIRALVEGIIGEQGNLLALLQKTLLDFLTSGITDLISGFFGGSLGVVGGGSSILSGGGGGGAGDAFRGMSVHVGPSRDPMSMARDGQWQAALRESLLVARSQGFK